MKGSWKEVEVCYHYSSRLGVHSLQGNTVYHISSQKKDIFNSEDYFYKEVLCFKKCLLTNLKNLINLPISCSSGKEPTSQCRSPKKCGFDPWIGKIPSLGRSPVWEDPLEEGMATHSNIMAWRIPWTEEPGEVQPMGSQSIRHDWNDIARMQHVTRLSPGLCWRVLPLLLNMFGKHFLVEDLCAHKSIYSN